MILRGWCFGSDGKPIRAIRLQAGELTLAGVVGRPRPDVKAAIPEAPDDHTGFEIRGTLPTGNIAVSLEAATADGTWHQLAGWSVQVPREFLPLCL